MNRRIYRPFRKVELGVRGRFIDDAFDGTIGHNRRLHGLNIHKPMHSGGWRLPVFDNQGFTTLIDVYKGRPFKLTGPASRLDNDITALGTGGGRHR